MSIFLTLVLMFLLFSGNNQRMEFLGDSVLQFVVSVYLFRHFPEHHEGHLTVRLAEGRGVTGCS